MMLNNDIYFVIVHWGKPELTQSAVLSVRLGAGVSASQIVVVENGAVVGVTPEQATTIKLAVNGGYAYGVNAGIRYVLSLGARWIIVMNNDLTYVAGAAEAMLAEAKKGFGCVGAIVSEGDKKPTLAGGFVDWFRGRTHFVFNKKDLHKLHYVSGAFFLITKECFESVGEMPEKYFHTWEDVAWSFRMRAKGWRLGFAQTSPIPHLCSQALPESKLKTYYLVRNGSLFVREYAPFWAKIWLTGLEPLRLLWAKIRGREEIVRALRDARNNVVGSITTPEVDQGSTSGVVRIGCGSLSVVIVTHQSEDDIGACLESVKKESVELNTEIVIVDAGSTDNTKDVVQKKCSEAKFFQLRNVGFAAAANLGAAMAQGEIVFFLNPDATLLPGALRQLVSRFAKIEQAGVIGGLLLSAPDRIEPWQMQAFPSLKNAIFSRRQKEAESLPKHNWLSEGDGLKECSWVSGGALAVPKMVFRGVGGFNERFFLYFEDVDLCQRIKNLGRAIFLDTKTMVLHKGGKSANQTQRVQAYDRSQNTYFLFHRPIFEYFSMRILRFFFRQSVKVGLGAGLVVVAFFGVLYGQWIVILCVGLITVLTLTVYFPEGSIWLLLGSLIVGQTVRLNIAQISGTVTDFLLPVVLLGLFYGVIIKGRIKIFSGYLATGWWLLLAVLPGIILAWQRLPSADFLVAFSYCARFFAILLLIPLIRTLQFSYFRLRAALVVGALILAFVGFFQLLVLPTLPPVTETFFSRLFLTMSGGGWDPHQYRLFSTWFDPNFLGLFFVMALGLILVGFGKFVAVTTPEVVHGATSGVVRRFDLILYWMAGLIIFIALTLTRSRASFLALLAMLVIYFLFSNVKRFFVPIITVCGLALLLSPAFTARIFVSPATDPTMQLRLQSWQQAIWHFQDYPWFGVGYNAYGVEQLATGNVTNANIHSLAGTDNFVLLFLVTTGLWGVIILSFGISRFLAWQIYFARGGSEAALSVLLLFVALFTHSLFIQSFTYIHLLLPLVLVIGTSQTNIFRVFPFKETP